METCIPRFQRKGDAVEAGIQKHKQINEKMNRQPLQILVNRETII